MDTTALLGALALAWMARATARRAHNPKTACGRHSRRCPPCAAGRNQRPPADPNAPCRPWGQDDRRAGCMAGALQQPPVPRKPYPTQQPRGLSLHEQRTGTTARTEPDGTVRCLQGHPAQLAPRPGHAELVQRGNRKEDRETAPSPSPVTSATAAVRPGSTRTTRRTSRRAGRWWGADLPFSYISIAI